MYLVAKGSIFPMLDFKTDGTIFFNWIPRCYLSFFLLGIENSMLNPVMFDCLQSEDEPGIGLKRYLLLLKSYKSW
jgi:hypothetical protein